MVATLSRAGLGYQVTNRRSFDPWGKVRMGAASGDPKGRYCANLGHVADDESALVYMRARYYDPAHGRFISEDPARDGANWFAYCDNEPVLRADASGKYLHLLIAFCGGFLFGALGAGSSGLSWWVGGLIGGVSALAGCAFGNPYFAGAVGSLLNSIATDFFSTGTIDVRKAMISAGLGAGAGALAAKIVAGAFSYQVNLTRLTVGEEVETATQQASKEAESALGACLGVLGDGAYSLITK